MKEHANTLWIQAVITSIGTRRIQTNRHYPSHQQSQQNGDKGIRRKEDFAWHSLA